MFDRILDVVITVLIQVLFMRDLEKLISAWRVVIIYVGSNVCGSLASATFLPYYVEVRHRGIIQTYVIWAYDLSFISPIISKEVLDVPKFIVCLSHDKYMHMYVVHDLP